MKNEKIKKGDYIEIICSNCNQKHIIYHTQWYDDDLRCPDCECDRFHKVVENEPNNP